jgi:hypothetical protein
MLRGNSLTLADRAILNRRCESSGFESPGKLKTGGRVFNSMNPMEYIKYGSKKSRQQEHGLPHYFLPDNRGLLPEKPLHSKIFPGKKTNFIDDHMRLKRDVPNRFYDTAGDLVNKTAKSNLCKAARKTFADEMADFNKKNMFPAPNTHSPNWKAVLIDDKACLTTKGARRNYLEEF